MTPVGAATTEPLPDRPANTAGGRADVVDLPPSRFDECLDVLHAAFGTEVADYGITAENTPSNPAFWDGSVIPGLVGRGFTLFGAEEDGRVVGCAFVRALPGRPEVWELRHLAVAPDARHRGFGELLVAEAVRRARGAGGRRLRIAIVAENRRLAGWYARLGFVTTKSRQQYDGLPFTVDHLELAF